MTEPYHKQGRQASNPLLPSDLLPAQQPRQDRGKTAGGYDRGGDVGNRLGEHDGRRAEQRRQYKYAHEEQPLAQHGERQTPPDKPHAGHAVHRRVLYRETEHAERIRAYHVRRHVDIRRVPGENPYKRAGNRLRENEHQTAERHAQQDDAAERLRDALRIACAVVIAEDGLRACRDAAERHGDDEHKALHDRRARDEHIAVRAAVSAQHDVHRDEQHVIQRNNERRRETDLHNTAHPAGIDRLPGDADRRLAAEQKAQDIRRRADLGKHGRERRAAHTHVQRKDENRVERDIDRRAEHDRPHGRRGKALTHRDLVEAVAHHREHRARDIGRKIRLGVLPQRLAAPEGEQNLPPEHE